MSCENRGALPPAASAPVYTVYPGEERDSVHYAFHPAHPQAPPPKYEDVVSGEYLKWNSRSYYHTAPPVAPNTSPPPPSQVDPPCQGNQKEKRGMAVGVLLFALILTGIFICRVSKMCDYST